MSSKARELESLGTGTTVKGIRLEELKSLKMRLPPKGVQMEIANILSTYDNLIENNNRRIAILQDMAQSLYKEWFVKFRFPGYENTKFKKTSLGLIPEGWEIKTASEVIDIAPKMSLPKVGAKPLESMPNVSTASMVIDEIEMREGNSGTKINPIGFGSTEFIVMRSNELTAEFVYCLARSDSFRGNAINSMAGADGRQRVKN